MSSNYLTSASPASPTTIPAVAESRIAHQGQPGAASMSYLGFSDHLLLQSAGLEAISMVVGLSVVHLGKVQLAGIKQPVELDGYGQAISMGRANALSRAQQEAAAMGADGLIIDGIACRYFDAEEHEYSVKGTAVRFAPQPGALRTPAGLPFTTWLGCMSIYLQLRKGYVPTSVGFGVCVYHVPHRSLRQALGQTFQNTEVPVFTDGWYTAREIAVSRLQAGLESAGAEHILAIDVKEEEGGFGEHTAEFLAIGHGFRHAPGVAELVPEADLATVALLERGAPYPTREV